MRFRIYYGDGSTYSGDPFKAPRENVQVIAVESNTPTGFLLVYGKKLDDSYYCWREDGGWFLHDYAGLHDYFHHYDGPQKTLLARTMGDTDAFWKIVDRASREGLGP